jgi:hypothetical protein
MGDSAIQDLLLLVEEFNKNSTFPHVHVDVNVSNSDFSVEVRFPCGQSRGFVDAKDALEWFKGFRDGFGTGYTWNISD